MIGGCNVVAFYQTTLFRQSIGLSEDLSRLLGGCSAIVFFVGTWPAIYLIEKVGRRKLLLGGSICTLCSMVAYTALLATGNGRASVAWGAVAMLFLFEL